MILSRKHGLTLADVYCGEELPQRGADVIRYNQWPVAAAGFRHAPFHTLVLDLTRSEQELLGNMDKGTRYEIRRASREALSAEHLRGEAAQRARPDFCDFYDQAARAKNLPAVDRKWLASMAQLELTRVSSGAAVLAWHAYHCGADEAVLLFSQSAHRSSPDSAWRQLIGRANRYLHWQDILQFRARGIRTLDLGGWYGGSTDQALLQINKFKEDLGGRVVEAFNSMAGVTLKGKLAVWYVQGKCALRQRRLEWSGGRATPEAYAS